MRLIDADALLETMEADVMGGLNYRHFVEKAPTIELKQGEWKDSYDASRICGIELKACSVCNKEYNRDLAKRFNFCPNCGARMKGADDNGKFKKA